jgi:hypothetical protein
VSVAREAGVYSHGSVVHCLQTEKCCRPIAIRTQSPA